MRWAYSWNATAEEQAAHLPCDDLAGDDTVRFTRAIDVDAPVPVVFRWLCQLSVAPYSYDWIDNLGRPSPRRLTPGAEGLAVGQRFMAGWINSLEPDGHITCVARSFERIVFGVEAMTYAVVPQPGGARIVGRMIVRRGAGLGSRLRADLMAGGDRIMMRRQLLNLKQCAEGANGGQECEPDPMATKKKRDPGPSVKDKKLYEKLRDEGESKQKSARIANQAAKSSRSSVGRKGGKGGDYEDWSKQKLYAKAKQVGIEGRSSMSKSELVKALRNS